MKIKTETYIESQLILSTKIYARRNHKLSNQKQRPHDTKKLTSFWLTYLFTYNRILPIIIPKKEKL